MAKSGVRVEGIPEVEAALLSVPNEFDSVKAAERAANIMLPDIRSGSRRKTGAGRRGWGYTDAKKEKGITFVNAQFYMRFQEFGTKTIDPTFAISASWESHQSDILDAYSDEVGKVGKRVGL